MAGKSLRQFRGMPATVRTLLLVLVLTGIGGALAFTLLARESYEREQVSIARYLSTVTAATRQSFAEWLQSRFEELESLARQDNFTLYMTESLEQQDASESYTSPELTYLRMQLQLTASRGGFEAKQRRKTPLPFILPGMGGIALFDRDWHPLISTRWMPSLEPLRQRLATLPPAKPALLDRETLNGERVLLFAVPVFSIQGMPVAGDQLGWLIALQPVEPSVLRLLKPAAGSMPGLALHWVYPSPDGGDQSDILSLAPPGTSEATAVTRAEKRPGELVEGRNSQGDEVLAMAEPVEGTGWHAYAELSRREALAETHLRLQRMLLGGGLAIALFLAGIIGLWRRVTQQRAEEVAELAASLAERQNVLDVITRNEPSLLFLCDAEGILRYSNQRFAALYSAEPAQLTGRSLKSAIGQHHAQRHLPVIQRVLAGGAHEQHIWESDLTQERQIYHTRYVPVNAFPAVNNLPSRPGVLVVAQDITDVVQEKEKTERLSSQLVQTIMRLLDRRDPYTADHSARVSRLARAVAAEMELDPVTARTVEIAGSLMNMGKIFVPEDIILQPGKLSDAELKKIRQSIVDTADMLNDVDFEGPVAETIRQCKEFWDGSGLLGLKKEKILLSARVIAACNAFVSLVSPRAFREALNPEEAVNTLLGDMGKLYDRAVVLALANAIAKHGKAIMK